MSRLPSASSLQLAAACAASQVLDGVSTAWMSGEKGTRRHELLAAAVLGEDFDAGDDADWLVAAKESFADRVPSVTSDDLTSRPSDEVAYAYDVVSGRSRVLGRRLGRAYPELAPTEIPGTADWVCVGAAERPELCIVDLKTGMSDVPHPSRNLQLRMLALAAARWHAIDEVKVMILHAPEGRLPWWEQATFDAFDLEEIALELRGIATRVLDARTDVDGGKTPRVTVGEHCTYCPARHGCPARVAMAKRLAGEPEAVVADLKAMLTPETAALALARWKAARKAIEEVGEALYAYAKESPIPLGNGRAWGPQTSETESIDANKAWPILRDAFGPEGARAAMTLKTSKAGVERLAKAMRDTVVVDGKKQTIKSIVEKTMQALRDGGCVETKTKTEYGEYAVGPLLVTSEGAQ